MRLSLLFVLALVLAGGCSAPQSAVEVKVLVGLQRTPCFGRCPVYEFSMLNTGEATLKVGRFCEEAFGRAMEEGMHTAKVDPSAWQEVLDLAARIAVRHACQPLRQPPGDGPASQRRHHRRKDGVQPLWGTQLEQPFHAHRARHWHHRLVRRPLHRALTLNKTLQPFT